jgi:hypothetical protein
MAPERFPPLLETTIRWARRSTQDSAYPHQPDSPVSTWSTFLANHANELWTMDVTAQPMWDCSVRYVLVLLELQS